MQRSAVEVMDVPRARTLRGKESRRSTASSEVASTVEDSSPMAERESPVRAETVSPVLNGRARRLQISSRPSGPSTTVSSHGQLDAEHALEDRKSTRLNSSHVKI